VFLIIIREKRYEHRYLFIIKSNRKNLELGQRLSAISPGSTFMVLAFPGQSGPLWEIIASDAFVDSLGILSYHKDTTMPLTS